VWCARVWCGVVPIRVDPLAEHVPYHCLRGGTDDQRLLGGWGEGRDGLGVGGEGGGERVEGGAVGEGVEMEKNGAERLR
jgi:hypothetical protein